MLASQRGVSRDLHIPYLGGIIPIMGMSPSGLADALFSRVQQRVLAILFGQPDRSFYANEIMRLVDSGTGAVQRELVRLADSGLITVTRIGNQKHYQANRQSPVFDELRGLVVKTVGLVAPLQAALQPLAKRIHAAFVYGSVAKGVDTARSDIDLMLLADDLAYADVYPAVEALETTLGRPVNPNVMRPADWRRKRRDSNPFVSKIARQPKLFVIGSDDAIA